MLIYACSTFGLIAFGLGCCYLGIVIAGLLHDARDN